MPLERVAGRTSLIDVLDRVLNKGIVIDAWMRVPLLGVDLIAVQGRMIVAAVDSYREYVRANKRRKGLKGTRQEPTGGSGCSGTPAIAGTAHLIPRAPAGRHRRPID
jgi:hypothetical protein